MGLILQIALPLVVLGLAVAFPILLSEVIGGWTKKYTSTVSFSAAKIPDLSGKVAIVTGANTGIGYFSALELARHGAEVIVASRSMERGMAAVEKMKQDIAQTSTNVPSITLLPLDLSSLESVEKFAQEFLALDKPLHILVNNAGVMKSPGSEFMGQEMTYGFETTQDGFEYHMGVNHIAHAYLTKLLGHKLQQSAPSRVVVVSSMAEQGSYESGFVFDDWAPAVNGQMPEGYEDGKAYGQSKLANLMFAKELAERWQGTGVTAYALHPGVIVSELGRYMEPHLEEQNQKLPWLQRVLGKLFMGLFQYALMSTPDGALTQLHLATAPADQLVNGAFYHPIGKVVTPYHAQGSNATLQKLLWDETEKAMERRNS